MPRHVIPAVIILAVVITKCVRAYSYVISVEARAPQAPSVRVAIGGVN